MSQKYYFVCKNCGHKIGDFAEWFKHGQKCPECGKNFVDAKYTADPQKLKDLIFSKDEVKSLWHYFDFLPLDNKENIISAGEGVAMIDKWDFLADFAKKEYGLDIEVFAMRHTSNNATRTFKDIAGTLGASVLKEAGIKDYAVASTGNTANAFSHYLAKAGINLYVFMPKDAEKENLASVSAYGQRAVVCDGDYAFAKKVAADFTAKHNVTMTIGNIDPIRVESKKTWVYNWLRSMGKLPTVYIQALSGGTGPIAVEKALNEVAEIGYTTRPRYISVQPSLCDPMTQAWDKAKAENFPDGWQNDYPKINNPKTKVQTLGTGIPGTYPIVAELTRKSGGDIITFDETKTADVARLIAFKTQEKIGPASAIAMGGFFDSLKKGLIKNGDVVMVNMGEGIERAASFLSELAYDNKLVSSADDIEKFDRAALEQKLWDAVK